MRFFVNMNDLQRTLILFIQIFLTSQSLRTGPVYSKVVRSNRLREWDLSLKLSSVPSMQPPEADRSLYFENMMLVRAHSHTVIGCWTIEKIVATQLFNDIIGKKLVAMNIAIHVYIEQRKFFSNVLVYECSIPYST